ncbi:MAG: insulinase family protein [Alistipes sp.]
MKRYLLLMAVIFAMFATSCNCKYEKVSGDPLKTRIYTLDNGLKVYMTVNKEAPRIQTFIAVKVGAKNDPIETTGLAHYFEHLMFKGTESFGTQNYAAEKPLLDQIEQLFEVYRKTTDPAERTAIYAQIDSISQEASKFSIPNEYDKLMAAIGASDTNAWTSEDETVYIEDIPSNQIENWAKIQSDRFSHNVIRGFHTELETVYEEYNMSLTKDSRKAYEGIMELLFPNHPYGQHSVLGFQEHLKNPSITNIKNYYKTYYVPNNMAICLSGDFDPDEMMTIINKYFGALTPSENLPKVVSKPETEITAPIEKEVFGKETAFVYLGWRTEGGAASDDAAIAQIVSSILSNGKCGLIDVDLAQKQKVLAVGAFDMMMAERGSIIAVGYPKEGQTLEEVRDLVLSEITKLRNGDFDEKLLSSALSNYKLQQMKQLDSNFGRAISFVNSFINGTEWKDEVTQLDRLSKITKEDVIAWAKKTFGDKNYVALYKRQGEDKNQKKIDKPHITPISTNRDTASPFLTEIQKSTVAPIQPVFVDFKTDMSIGKMKHDIPVLYKHNETNDLFSLMYLYEFGTNDDPALSIAVSDYFNLLGTDSMSLSQIQSELYALACNFNIIPTTNRTYVMINGLGENMQKAITLVENYMRNVKGDDTILEELKSDLIKARADSKLDQQSNFSALREYTTWGADVVKARTLTNEQLRALKSNELITEVTDLAALPHRVMYYGPLLERQLVAQLDETHYVADQFKPLVVKNFKKLETPSDQIVLAQYDAKQIYYFQGTNLGIPFNVKNDAILELYNAYFSGGMNAIVFQEMREARALAYSASAWLQEGRTAEEPYVFSAFIATQNDKMKQAVETFEEIIENMPESQAAFDIAKQGILANLETQRTIKDNVLWAYVFAQQKGIDYDRNKAVYETVKNLTLADVKKFQQEWIKGRHYTFSILGDAKDLDLNYLKTVAPIRQVSQEEIFGY